MKRCVVDIRRPDAPEMPEPAALAGRRLQIMKQGYGLVALKRNVRKIELVALITGFKILID
jgi:hypothetical protein